MKTRSTSRPDAAEERRSAAGSRPGAQRKPVAAAVMPDARAASLAQLRQQEQASNSTQAIQLKAQAELMAAGSGDAPVQRVEDEELLQGKFETVQRMDEEDLLQGKFEALQRKDVNKPLQGEPAQLAAFVASGEVPVQRQEKPNNTGLPDQVKSGIEALSGMRMDHVKVHYNSAKPAQLQAHAYAQGSEIHVAPGQEQHVPHEAWHIVQQARGRVKPTMQMKDGVTVNDEVTLEEEADLMGAKAASLGAGLADHDAKDMAFAPASSTFSSAQRKPAAGGTGLFGPVVQRELFEHGGKTLETTDYSIQGGEQSNDLHDILADMAEVGAVDDIISLRTALEADFNSESEDTVEWVKANGDIKLMFIQISTILNALQNPNRQDSGEGRAAASSIDESSKEGGQTIGKMFFPGDTYHQVVKGAVIAAIGVKELSFLVYRDKKHHNFNFWFERDGSIFAEVNSNRNSKGKDTGYRWDGNAVVKND